MTVVFSFQTHIVSFCDGGHTKDYAVGQPATHDILNGTFPSFSLNPVQGVVMHSRDHGYTICERAECLRLPANGDSWISADPPPYNLQRAALIKVGSKYWMLGGRLTAGSTSKYCITKL